MNVLGSILGDEAVIISPDDEAIVKHGVVAAKMQTAIVMHLEYKLRLPNHDFIVANKHHLIPSAYAFLDINNQKVGRSTAVSGKGPTAVFIRTGKTDHSEALSPCLDFERHFPGQAFWDLHKTLEEIRKYLYLKVKNISAVCS